MKFECIFLPSVPDFKIALWLFWQSLAKFSSTVFFDWFLQFLSIFGAPNSLWWIFLIVKFNFFVEIQILFRIILSNVQKGWSMHQHLTEKLIVNYALRTKVGVTGLPAFFLFSLCKIQNKERKKVFFFILMHLFNICFHECNKNIKVFQQMALLESERLLKTVFVNIFWPLRTNNSRVTFCSSEV